MALKISSKIVDYSVVKPDEPATLAEVVVPKE